MEKIILTTGNHCIETSAKKKYKELLDRYFEENNPEKELEEKIEILRDFIERSDFSKLRSMGPEYSGEIEARIRLTRNESGEMECIVTE